MVKIRGKRELYRVSGNSSCQHKSIANLGTDSGNNEYSECTECGALLVAEGESDPEEEREMWRKLKQKSILEKLLRR